MKAGIGLLILIGLAGCTKQSEREEEKLGMVENGRDNVAVCDQAKRVADAYLNEHDTHGYEIAKARSDAACMKSSFEPYNTEGVDGKAAMLGGDDLTAIAN